MKQLTLLFLYIFVTDSIYSQTVYANKFGKGLLNIEAKDSSFTLKMSVRIQNLFEGESVIKDGQLTQGTSSFLVRRSRLKFDGYVLSPKVEYKIELGLSNRDHANEIPQASNTSNVVMDAYLEWHYFQNFSILIGQTKLPGNRERVISSQKMQLVDRSELNSRFNIDRDIGVQLKHFIEINSFLIKEIVAISQGEGRNITGGNMGGYEYTGRLELLPFGEFKSEGDYFGSDLKREETPKLALGFTYDYNDRAYRSRGNLGSFLSAPATLQTFFADMMFKYKGFSVMAEYADKTADNPEVKNLITGKSDYFYTGSAINGQMGYLFKNNYEIAARYTSVTPEKITKRNPYEQYTLGMSKYIVDHNLKVQADVTLNQEEKSDDVFTWRFQVELAF